MVLRPDAPARRNVVLTGFMGTGKSTVGRILADELRYDFIDTDHVIEVRNEPIPQIFAEYGEGEFRRLERALAAELAEREGLVISTGGRLMLDAVNAETLGGSADVYCLTASVGTILERVIADAELIERPLLAGTDVEARVTELLAERTDAYGRFEQVDTDGRSAAEVAAELATRVRR